MLIIYFFGWKYFLVVNICLVVILSGAILFQTQYFFKKISINETSEVMNVYTNAAYGVQMNYPNSYTSDNLTEADKQAGIIFRIARDTPAAMFSVRNQKGFGAMKFLGGSTLETFVEEVNRRYPERFPEYKKERYERTILANEDAAILEFSYLGKDNLTRMRQRLVILAHNNQVYLLSAQAQYEEFGGLDKEFTSIIKSFQFL